MLRRQACGKSDRPPEGVLIGSITPAACIRLRLVRIAYHDSVLLMVFSEHGDDTSLIWCSYANP